MIDPGLMHALDAACKLLRQTLHLISLLLILILSLSFQALIDYTNGKPWIKEISAFIDDVIGGEPVVLVVGPVL